LTGSGLIRAFTGGDCRQRGDAGARNRNRSRNKSEQIGTEKKPKKIETALKGGDTQNTYAFLNNVNTMKKENFL
jgi:hypothetical protein